jgi:hypothetical protein
MLHCKEGSEVAIFIELKGADFSQACKQILNSIQLLSGDMDSTAYKYCARIVLSKAKKILSSGTRQKGGLPDIRDTNYVNLMKKLANPEIGFDYASGILTESKIRFS